MSKIAVYADWEGLRGPLRLGFLHSRRTRASELFEFEYAAEALTEPLLGGVRLDPHLHAFGGPQYPPAPRDKFGVFDDSSPDRWGRNLMDRRFEREKRAGLLPADARLMSAAGKWW